MVMMKIWIFNGLQDFAYHRLP